MATGTFFWLCSLEAAQASGIILADSHHEVDTNADCDGHVGERLSQDIKGRSEVLVDLAGT